MKAWDKFKAESKARLASAKGKVKGKMKRADRKHVNVVQLTDEEVASFRHLASLQDSVKDLRAQALEAKKLYRESIALHWDALEDKYALGGKFHVDVEAGEIFQLGKKL